MWNIFCKILNFGWKHLNLILQFLLQKRGNSRASSAVVKDSLSSHRERYSIMADARPSTTHAMRVGIEIRPRFSVVWVHTHHFLPSPPNIKRVSATCQSICIVWWPILDLHVFWGCVINKIIMWCSILDNNNTHKDYKTKQKPIQSYLFSADRKKLLIF